MQALHDRILSVRQPMVSSMYGVPTARVWLRHRWSVISVLLQRQRENVRWVLHRAVCRGLGLPQ